MIVFLAALQGVPRELIEAAMIDGATPFGAFRRVVVPLLGPATLFLVVWSTINALQLFDEIYFLTKGGPLFSTYVLVYYVFDLAFQKGLAGLRRGGGVHAVRGDPRADRDPAGDRAADGALLVMSAASTSPAAGSRKSRWPLPFCPGTCVLAPIALVMVTPLALDARDVDRDRGRDAPVPARDHPVGHPLAELLVRPHRGAVRALVHEHDDRHRRRR